jgi:WD40 repeat protein
VSASHDGDIFLWDTNRYELITKISTNEPIVTMIGLKDNLIAFSSNDKINIWDINKFKSSEILIGHTCYVYHLTLMKNGYLLSASADKSIRIWNITTGKSENSLNGHSKAVKCLSELPNNRVASGSEDMTIKIWDLNSKGSLITSLFGHSGFIRTLICLENDHLASAALDSLIFIWNLNTFKLVKTIESMETVYILGYLKSGVLVSGLSNGYIQIWNQNDYSLIKTVFIDDEEIRCFALLENGYLAMGLANRVLNILKIQY